MKMSYPLLTRFKYSEDFCSQMKSTKDHQRSLRLERAMHKREIEETVDNFENMAEDETAGCQAINDKTFDLLTCQKRRFETETKDIRRAHERHRLQSAERSSKQKTLNNLLTAECEHMSTTIGELRAQLADAQKDNKALKTRLTRVVTGRQQAQEAAAAAQQAAQEATFKAEISSQYLRFKLDEATTEAEALKRELVARDTHHFEELSTLCGVACKEVELQKSQHQEATTAAETVQNQLNAEASSLRDQLEVNNMQHFMEVEALCGELELQSTQHHMALVALKVQHQLQLQALEKSANKSEEGTRETKAAKGRISDDTATTDLDRCHRAATSNYKRVEEEAQTASVAKQVVEAKATAVKAMKTLTPTSCTPSSAASHKGPNKLFLRALAAATNSRTTPAVPNADAVVVLKRKPAAKQAAGDNSVKAEEELAAAKQAVQEANLQAQAAQQQLTALAADNSRLMGLLEQHTNVTQVLTAELQQQATYLQATREELYSTNLCVNELVAMAECLARQQARRVEGQEGEEAAQPQAPLAGPVVAEEPAEAEVEPVVPVGPWGPAPQEQQFTVIAEVVSGGDCPTLSSGDGRRLTCHAINELLYCDAQPHCCIPAVHIPGAVWGDLVEVGLGWELVDGVWVFTSRLLQHWEAGAEDAGEPLVASYFDSQRVMQAALDRW